MVCCTEPELTGPFYIVYIRLRFNSKIVNNSTNDNELILPAMTDKRQTRPLVREGATHGQDSNFQTRVETVKYRHESYGTRTQK
jgi:hypothetical protein